MIPLLVRSLIYPTHERLLHRPTFSGLDNYLAVIRDDAFWQAAWFSLRFGLITALTCRHDAIKQAVRRFTWRHL